MTQIRTARCVDNQLMVHAEARACTQVSSPDGRPSCSIGELTMILFHASLGCSREPKYIKIFMIHVFEECHCFRVKRRRSVCRMFSMQQKSCMIGVDAKIKQATAIVSSMCTLAVRLQRCQDEQRGASGHHHCRPKE